MRRKSNPILLFFLIFKKKFLIKGNPDNASVIKDASEGPSRVNSLSGTAGMTKQVLARSLLSQSSMLSIMKSSMIAALLMGVLFQPPGLFADEISKNEAAAYEDAAAPISTDVPQNLQYLPLSTWLGPGDILRIKSFPDTALFISGDYPILENGFAMLPIIGLVQVTSLSTAALTANLVTRYAKYLAYPSIQVEPIIRISFLGGFLVPGMHKVNPMLSFSNALYAAQGPVRDDGLRMLRWERGGKVLATDLTSVVEASKSLSALGFKSGDQICVTILTQRDRLTVIGLIASTLLSAGTLALTIWAVSQ